MQRTPLVRKVEEFLRRLDASDGIVTAVSGGPDSVALLRALVALQPARTLVIAHLNHQLRGTDSDADETFVRELYAALASQEGVKLELRCERIDVAALVRAEGGNLEQVARQVRYDWLTRVAQEAGLHWIATAHSADDQAETVLHHLLRGAGLKGLRGIASRRDLTPGIALIRPMLRVARAEVLAYLDQLQQPFRLDLSNLDLSFTRNRIRHQLLPHLAETYNPAVVSVLSRLAEEADAVFRDIEASARALLSEVERPRAGALVILDRMRLAEAPRNLVRETFRLLWEREGWPMGEMTFDAWDRIAGVVLGESHAVDLPADIRVRAGERVIQVGRVS